MICSVLYVITIVTEAATHFTIWPCSPTPSLIHITGAMIMVRQDTFAAFMLRRKCNPSDFYSKATQLELVAKAKEYGDAFWFDPSKGKAHD